MRKQVWFLFLSTLWLCSAESTANKECYANTKSTADIIVCMDKEYSEYDHALNRYYTALMQQIEKVLESPKTEKIALKKAQRSWIAYRDEKCKFEGYPMRRGSGEGLLVYSCKIEMTKQRAKELHTYLKDMESYQAL